jgi:hypothetical protein
MPCMPCQAGRTIVVLPECIAGGSTNMLHSHLGYTLPGCTEQGSGGKYCICWRWQAFHGLPEQGADEEYFRVDRPSMNYLKDLLKGNI